MVETARMADVDHIVVLAVENEDRRLDVRHMVNGTAMSIPVALRRKDLPLSVILRSWNYA